MMVDKFTPIDSTKPFEVVLVVFKHTVENGIDNRTSMAQTALRFNNTKELLEWADDSGVDFS